MRQTKTRALAATGTLGLVLALAACGGGSGADESAGSGGGEQTLTVLAAASLTDVFDELAAGFEAEHDGVTVEASYGSSTDLAEQAADQAPGDVLATADETAMQIAEDAEVATDPQTFATNVLVIVTPPGNPAGVESLEDLDGADWVRCADEVPCGRVALSVLDANDVDVEPVSLEEDVRATLDKVESGEADAGLVYATDAVSAGDGVDTIEIPGSEDQLTSYLISPLAQSEDADLAGEWVDYITSEDGQDALVAAGFTLP